MASGDLPGGYGADDGAGVHYVDGVAKYFIGEAAGKRVYRVLPSDLPTASGVLVEPQKMTVLRQRSAPRAQGRAPRARMTSRSSIGPLGFNRGR